MKYSNDMMGELCPWIENGVIFLVSRLRICEELERLVSRSVPIIPRAYAFRSAHFHKTNKLQRHIFARGLHDTDKIAHADTKNK